MKRTFILAAALFSLVFPNAWAAAAAGDAPAQPSGAGSYSVPGQFTIASPGGGLQWSQQRTYEVNGAEVTVHLCADGPNSDRIILLRIAHPAENERDRRDVIAYHVELMRDSFEQRGAENVKEVRQELPPDKAVPVRVTYSMSGESKLRDGRYQRWYAAGATCFGRSTYAVLAYAKTEASASRLAALANTLEEPQR